MSRRRQSYGQAAPISADDLHLMTFGEQRHRDHADLTVLPDRPSPEDEWAEAFADALLFGAALVVLGAATPFVLLLAAVLHTWVGGR